MTIPFVIDNQRHRLADALNELLAQSRGKPVDIDMSDVAGRAVPVSKHTAGDCHVRDAERRQRRETLRLLDIRTREEWDATRIDGAEFVNQELVQELMAKSPRDVLVVFYDHDGKQCLDAAAYFAGHGFTNARFLRGGIDAWSREVDSSVRRYKLEAAR